MFGHHQQTAADVLAESQLVASVQESLAVFQYESAKFLGERLVALHNSEVRPRLASLVCMGADEAHVAGPSHKHA